jgi:hypothetical protein
MLLKTPIFGDMMPYVYTIYIQGVPGGIINISEGSNKDYSE